eukprot:TRINITY_DN781906_c0_g1_i1.p1 TRINITY_DN781906_c0_g1~~TRINITY_DN781906_c0_g1_i1.p1  ORF type:complete len:152 (+),score=51.51 TRINITY_DN781906_c0_g1_i1:119-574(+)
MPPAKETVGTIKELHEALMKVIDRTPKEELFTMKVMDVRELVEQQLGLSLSKKQKRIVKHLLICHVKPTPEKVWEAPSAVKSFSSDEIQEATEQPEDPLVEYKLTPFIPEISPPVPGDETPSQRAFNIMGITESDAQQLVERQNKEEDMEY